MQLLLFNNGLNNIGHKKLQTACDQFWPLRLSDCER